MQVMRVTSIFVALLLAAAVLGACSAGAIAQEPLPGDSRVVPADGASWRAASWPDPTVFEMVDFAIYLDEYAADEEVDDFDVEVSTSPALDPDGTLADADRIDAYVALPLAAHPEIFTVKTNLTAEWVATPGTYYWQAHYDEDGELYVSEVHRLTITPRPAADPPTVPAPTPALPAPVVATSLVPAPAPLPARTVRTWVRRAIDRATHRTPSGLVYRCRSSSAGGAATCRPSWHDARFAYRGTLRISAGRATTQVAFTGTRAARSCRRRCVRGIQWSISLATGSRR